MLNNFSHHPFQVQRGDLDYPILVAHQADVLHSGVVVSSHGQSDGIDYGQASVVAEQKASGACSPRPPEQTMPALLTAIMSPGCIGWEGF